MEVSCQCCFRLNLNSAGLCAFKLLDGGSRYIYYLRPRFEKEDENMGAHD